MPNSVSNWFYGLHNDTLIISFCYICCSATFNRGNFHLTEEVNVVLDATPAAAEHDLWRNGKTPRAWEPMRKTHEGWETRGFAGEKIKPTSPQWPTQLIIPVFLKHAWLSYKQHLISLIILKGIRLLTWRGCVRLFQLQRQTEQWAFPEIRVTKKKTIKSADILMEPLLAMSLHLVVGCYCTWQPIEHLSATCRSLVESIEPYWNKAQYKQHKGIL